MSGMAGPAAVDDIISQFDLSSTALQTITDHFVSQLKLGLLDSNLPFQLPAFVTAIPDGTETGRFLSVDLGGTNCRICMVDLHGHGSFSVVQEKHTVPRYVMVNSRYDPLFSWLAAQIGTFAQAQKLFPQAGSDAATKDRKVPLGFTFSFTCDQVSLASGTLLHWDKGWDIPSALGRDPCQLLQEALDSANIPVRVTALANDSVGTLLAQAYTSGGQQATTAKTLAGMIVGTGTNAAYVERLRHVKRHGVEAERASLDDVMIINTEWGCLDDSLIVLPRTRFDDELDAHSTDRGSQMLEKRVSGMYLGELFRLAVEELYRLNNVFDFVVADNSTLLRMAGVDSSLLSLLADSSLDDEAKTKLVATTLALQDTSSKDLAILQRISAAIMTRAARLVGAALAAIVIQSGHLGDGVHVDESSPSPSPSFPKTVADDSKFYLGTLEPPNLGRNKERRNSASPAEAESSIVPPPKSTHNLHLSAVQGDGRTQTREADTIDIGVTGSVIEYYPTFEAEMRAALQEISGIGPQGEKRIRAGVCKDGSAVGAALMAQAALSTKD
ncbi:glucokinase [Grosmannia clavigera kw1407]|uniref:Phosphotransferase n=1 Tax=Grosmannia clavigera (strain kw1407 / UAMH 11150) TaxID=655863 RepID=F0XAX4_GROCL|nr:glucokinase [Grosmannia clavigera kw1407]EFX05177.1 glucokinase [Grosmannia clavigera kw1407]